jgi:hypothetical protein
MSNIIRLISNLCHINKFTQDLILDEGYLNLCLNFTEMNDLNPLARDWSIILIRNLTDSNDNMK